MALELVEEAAHKGIQPRHLVAVHGQVLADFGRIRQVRRDDHVLGLVRGGNGVGLVGAVRIEGSQPKEERLIDGSLAQCSQPVLAAAWPTAVDAVEVLLGLVTEVPLAGGGGVVSSSLEQSGKGHLVGGQGLMQFGGAGAVGVSAGDYTASRR